ncbi:unnamed protein product [Mycetohabitans rhizoxinica HKI 454]|uniref:Uncharacterized protein n=1 Tax=Mycetohabitans rhizoxinica (strain DSM 19002 / CIP 109453 / HKI 454) TaxID=882378 RepID=E5AT16_MYCRK|nr:unnamed protein product [Mycetohabitans rhizoxinica HKI 454]
MRCCSTARCVSAGRTRFPAQIHYEQRYRERAIQRLHRQAAEFVFSFNLYKAFLRNRLIFLLISSKPVRLSKATSGRF